MHSITSDTSTVGAFCVWPSEAPSPQRAPTEVDLVVRSQARDATAFREIVETYASRIYGVCYAILGNRDDANDVAQEVFAAVYSSIHGFAGRSSLYAWIYRIAVNECYVLLRQKRLDAIYPGDSPADTQSPAMEIAQPPTPDQTAVQRDFINNLLADVPKSDRWLLIAKEIDGVSIPELSKMTGLNETTVKRRLFRVRQSVAAAAHGAPDDAARS
jgi:RNA polymerase sigma-70 factor, ECF subfamily